MRRQRRLLFLPLALILVAVGSVHGQDIDDFVKSWMEQQHVPAVAIAVVKGGAATLLITRSELFSTALPFGEDSICPHAGTVTASGRTVPRRTRLTCQGSEW
jgi:hypothetical protein